MIIVLENNFQTVQIIQEINHLITLTTEVDHQTKETLVIYHKTDIVDQIVEILNIENNCSRSNSNRPAYSFDNSSHSHSRNRHYSNDRSGNSSYNRPRNYSNNRNRSYSNNRNPRYQNNRSRDYLNNRSNHHRSNYNNYQNRSRDNSQKSNSNYNKRQRNYSQSPHRDNTRYPDSQNKYRSNTPKHQRQINQVQTIEETNLEPPGIDNTESTELQSNHINCESTDSESDTENTILVNMIEVENDYETVTSEQPFHSHVYENQLELLLNYYIRPRSNNIPKEQEAKEATTLHEPEKKTNNMF